VAEADAHAGYLGGELDTLGQPPAGAPPFSTLIGAWLTRKEGALAQYAAGVMGADDYKASATLVFPTIVVLAFIGDIARLGPTALRPQHFDFERLIATPAEAQDTGGGACSTIAGWVSGVVNSVIAAVTANGNSWLATLWNTVVTVVGVAVSVAFASLTRFLTTIATICGTLMQVASMFKPWSVQLAKDPATMMLSPTPEQGQFIATLQAQDIPWPTTLIDCVQTLSHGSVTLDSASYTDAPVTWTPTATTPGLAAETSDDTKLLANKTAAYHFQTRTQTAPAGCPRTFPAGTVGVTVSVARTDITRTLDGLVALITNQLTPAIQTYLGPFISAALAEPKSTAAKFAAPHESAIIAVSEEIEDLPCSPSSPRPSAPAATPSAILGHGVLPGPTCESALTPGDTEPNLNGGAVFIPTDPETGEKLDIGKLMGQLINGSLLTAPNGQSLIPSQPTVHDVQYDASQSSICVIGTQSPMALDAMFTVVPKGTAPYHLLYDLRTADARSPMPCRSVIGIDLLNYYNADCRDETMPGGILSVTLFGPTVEYIIVGGGQLSPTTTEADLAAVLRSIARRSRT
jgi:hypothetical protein